MLPPLAIPVSFVIAVPVVVVIEMATRRRPVPFEIAAAFPRRFHPIGISEWRACPVTGVPHPTSVQRIPIALDPLIFRARLHRHSIHPRRRRWRAKGETE